MFEITVVRPDSIEVIDQPLRPSLEQIEDLLDGFALPVEDWTRYGAHGASVYTTGAGEANIDAMAMFMLYGQGNGPRLLRGPLVIIRQLDHARPHH